MATLKFDMPTLKSRIAVLHGLMREQGRDPADIELGGLALLGLSTDAKDQHLRDMAKGLGFPDYATAQAAPVCLLGTADEVKREIHRRIAETGVTYFICVMATPATMDIFAGDVMPEFVS